MRRLLSSLSLAILLASCGPNSVQYELRFDTTSKDEIAELSAATVRTVQGRLDARKATLAGYDLRPKDDHADLFLKIADAAAAEQLEKDLSVPFTMRLMVETEKGKGDISNEVFGDFRETGITEKHFAGVQAIGAANGKGAVLITLTPEGQTMLKKVFEGNLGKSIGLFVRGNLMSRKLVEKSDLDQVSLTIDGIPQIQIASAFADDVNVGLHVKFTPVK